MPRPIALVAWMMCACNSSCDENGSSASTIGELGNGTFHYTCNGAGDPVCELGLFGRAFPDCIALGGSFHLDYTLRDLGELDDDELAPFLFIESANASFFSGGDDVFTARRVGTSAFVARDNDVAVDLIHLDIVAPDRMEVVGIDPAAPVDAIELGVGDVALFRAFPRSSQCVALGGAIEVEASSSDSVVASVGTADVIEIAAHAPGTAIVTIELGELTHEMTVEVSGAPRRTKPDPDDDSSSSGDASSDDASSEGASSEASSSDGGTSSEGTGG